jgi:hemerythrin-like domain-containing protein
MKWGPPKGKKMNKLKVIIYMLLLLAPSAQPLLARVKKEKPKETVMEKKEDDIPATEDLMREHGILNRILLIYDDVIKKIDAGQHVPRKALKDAIEIIKKFIEEYHEKMEEDYIFPLFEKRKKEVRLVKTLRAQHISGRKITASLLELLNSKKELNAAAKKTIKSLLQKFIDMYRPHEAREDTILFPQVRGLMSEKEFEAMSHMFETSENKLFGEHGFEVMIKKVEHIEKELAIYNLEQFTPKNV